MRIWDWIFMLVEYNILCKCRTCRSWFLKFDCGNCVYCYFNMICCFNSLPPNVVCCLDPGQPDKTSGLSGIQSVWHSDVIPERIFQKKLILKKKNKQTTKKHEKFPRGAKRKLFIWSQYFVWRLFWFFKFKQCLAHIFLNLDTSGT